MPLIVLGGVVPIPWRLEDAENRLVGNEINDSLIAEITALAIADSVPLSQNGYKVELVQRLLRKSLIKTK